METWLNFARGPLFWFAIVFAGLGVGRLVVITCWEIVRAYYRAGDRTTNFKAVAKATRQWMIPMNVVKTRAFYGLTSLALHVGILLTPILLAGHIALIHEATGLWWPGIPNILADILTVVVLLSVLALIVQRVVRPEVRASSLFQDHAVLLLIALPFASGFLVMHPGLNPIPFNVTLLVHVLSADLVLILIPLTKISHCLLMPLSQLAAETSWHWPPDAGSKVAVALKKENEPI